MGQPHAFRVAVGRRGRGLAGPEPVTGGDPEAASGVGLGDDDADAGDLAGPGKRAGGNAVEMAGDVLARAVRLFQVPADERAIVEGSRAWSTADDIERFIAMRAEHHQAMTERQPPLKIWSVIPEGLLRQEVGGRAVAKAQVEHLIDRLRGDPNTTIQVLPLSAGAHTGMDGPFMLM